MLQRRRAHKIVGLMLNAVVSVTQRCALGVFAIGICALGVVPMVVTAAVADEGETVAAPGIIVNIRVVKALGEIREDAPVVAVDKSEALTAGIVQSVVANITGASQELAAAPKQKVEPVLEDIGAKLSKLHYREFKLASSQDVAIPLMKKRVVYLSDGHTLAIRPLYVDGSKIGIWLRWVDAAGTRVLDTRMHFHEEETMLAGTEVPCSRSSAAAAHKAHAAKDQGDGGQGDGEHAATVLAIKVQPAS